MKLVLSMGLKPSAAPRAPLRPHLRCLDLPTGAVTDLFVPAPGPHHPAEEEHAELTGATRDGDVLWQCTRTEVLTLAWGSWTPLATWSHPRMHDVHHALPYDGGLAVASTGLDLVLQLNERGELRAEHWLGHGDFQRRFGQLRDARTLRFDHHKPHQAHPNHLLVHDGALHTTCLQTRELRRVTPSPRPVWTFDAPPHDGRWLGDAWWFTTVDGHVVALDASLSAERLRIDVGALHTSPGLLGWCRGVERVGSRLFVGMSMLRASTHRELARRVLRGRSGHKLPTRVLELDLDQRRLVRSYPVGNAAGGTIYALNALT